MGKIEGHDFSWNAAPDHIEFHQGVFVESMFTNPPFSDCDAQLHIDVTVKWVINDLFGGRQVINAWPSSIGGGLSYGFCPGTAAIQGVAGVAYGLFGHVREMMDRGVQHASDALRAGMQNSVIQHQIGQSTLDSYRQIVQVTESNGQVVPGSIRIKSLFIDDQGLELSYQYSVRKN
jgi:hypothetical protein